MKIGLIYPNKGKKEKAFHVGLASIAAYARIDHSDLEFTILDTRISSAKEEKDFFNTCFDLVGITAMAGIFSQVLEVADRVKEIHPNTTICVGGPYVSTLGLEIMNFKSIDLAVYGEGEKCFTQIIDYLKSAIDLMEIKGLIFRNEAGETIQNLPSTSIRNIDELPMPAYDLFDMNAYPIHRIVTSRGCPY